MAQRVGWSEFWFLYGQTFKLMIRGVLWLPLLIQAVIAVLLAVVFYNIFSPVTGWLVSGWVELVKSDYARAFFHYPNQFVLFPYYFGNARLLINILIEAFLISITIDMMIALYRGTRPAFAQSFKNALHLYGKVTLVWLALNAILYFVNMYFFDILEGVGFSLANAPRRQMAASVVLRTLTILIYMPFIYMLPSIVAGGVSFGQAIGRGFRTFIRHPFVAFGLVVVAYLVGLPFSLAASESETVVKNFYPEMVFYLVLISIGVDMIVNFLLLGTSVKFFMDQTD